MKQLIIAIIILCIASLACGVDEPDTKPAADYVEKFGGSLSEYERILALSNCAGLRAEFEQVEENAKLQEPDTEQHRSFIGYMIAIDDRMEELECFEDPMEGMRRQDGSAY